MKNIKFIYNIFYLLLLILFSCSNKPTDPPKSCEFDYENLYNALDYNYKSKFIISELNTIFEKVGSTYLSNWKWERENDLDIAYIVVADKIVDHHPTLETFAEDNLDKNVDFHVFSVGTKPFIDNVPDFHVGGFAFYHPDDQKEKRYAFVLMGDIQTRFKPSAYYDLAEERYYYMRHVFGHELGHHFADLKHTYDFPALHHGTDLTKCLMSRGIYSDFIPPVVRQSFFCKDPNEENDCCAKFIKAKLYN